MNETIGSALGDTARLLRRTFDKRARDIGVTRPQWQVLTMLRRHEGVNQGGLAELLEVEPITLCRMVDRLQEAGLVERRPDPSDRRVWRLYLTEKAHPLIEKLLPLATTMFDTALEGLSETEQASLIAILNRIRLNLSREPDQPMVSNG